VQVVGVAISGAVIRTAIDGKEDPGAGLYAFA